MRSAQFGGMPAAMALSFAVHAAALASGLLLVGWERPVEPEAITVELVTLPASGSLDGSAADRPSPSPDETRAEPAPEPAAEPEPAPLVTAAPEEASPAGPPEDAPPAPPPEAVAAKQPAPPAAVMPAPEAEVMAAVAEAPVAHPPLPEAKPAPRALAALPKSPPVAEAPPVPTAAGPAAPAAVPRASDAEAKAHGGEGPARGLSRDAMSLPGNPAPAYPLGARRQGIEGQVILRLLVMPSGDPADVTVRRSSGHAVLDESALDAVKRWRFRPALRGGQPVDAMIEVPVTFRLDG